MGGPSHIFRGIFCDVQRYIFLHDVKNIEMYYKVLKKLHRFCTEFFTRKKVDLACFFTRENFSVENSYSWYRFYHQLKTFFLKMKKKYNNRIYVSFVIFIPCIKMFTNNPKKDSKQFHEIFVYFVYRLVKSTSILICH